ncbi:hypothetical protein [Nocardia gipuzkoensis]
MPEVQSWRFTALEFRTLWESTGRDVLPYPLQHQYTTEFRSESLRLRQAAAQELERPRPPVRDAWRPTPREEFERFFTRAMTLIGHVGVYAMGSVDNRHINGRKDFQLNDVENDGRYVTFGTDVVTIKPTTADRIAATLQQMMARTVTEVRDGVHLPY